jgi:hypothetical protein
MTTLLDLVRERKAALEREAQAAMGPITDDMRRRAIKLLIQNARHDVSAMARLEKVCKLFGEDFRASVAKYLASPPICGDDYLPATPTGIQRTSVSSGAECPAPAAAPLVHGAETSATGNTGRTRLSVMSVNRGEAAINFAVR